MVFRYRNFLFDLFRLLSRINSARAVNLVLIYAGFWLSALTRRLIVWGNPFSLSVEVSSLCNLSCPQCIKGKGSIKRDCSNLSLLSFEKLAGNYRRSVFYANLYFQGEPFLNPELSQIIQVASKNGFYTCVSTNGHFLDEASCNGIITSGLDRIIVSLDGLNQASYSFYRKGGSWQKVVDGISTLVRVRKQRRATNPLLVLQFLVNRENEKEIISIKKFARTLGVDMVQLKSMQIYGNSDYNSMLPLNKRYNRYYASGSKRILNSKSGGAPCFRLWSHAVYTSDGIAVPCCYDKIPEYPLNNKTGENLWFSPEMNAFRRKLMFQRNQVGICCNCAF
ncbi:MAG TPA: radical SAM protein [Bacteroidales bacterium]|nr:radical SAM protein [Bacteroidales bacterium]